MAQSVDSKSKKNDSSDSKTYVLLKGSLLEQDIEDLADLYGMCTASKEAKEEAKQYLFPFRRHLKNGETYNYCQCGRSTDFPFCDFKSHTISDVESGKGPIQFKIIKDQSMHLLCGCHLSDRLPFCDGSHINPKQKKKQIKFTKIKQNQAKKKDADKVSNDNYNASNSDHDNTETDEKSDNIKPVQKKQNKL